MRVISAPADKVMVDGNILMEERQLQTLELSSILEQAAHQSIDLIERSQS